MKINLDRSKIIVTDDNFSITFPGEMFFLESNKIGFVIYKSQINFENSPIKVSDIENALKFIELDFYNNGHVLEIEE